MLAKIAIIVSLDSYYTPSLIINHYDELYLTVTEILEQIKYQFLDWIIIPTNKSFVLHIHEATPEISDLPIIILPLTSYLAHKKRDVIDLVKYHNPKRVIIFQEFENNLPKLHNFIYHHYDLISPHLPDELSSIIKRNYI